MSDPDDHVIDQPELEICVCNIDTLPVAGLVTLVLFSGVENEQVCDRRAQCRHPEGELQQGDLPEANGRRPVREEADGTCQDGRRVRVLLIAMNSALGLNLVVERALIWALRLSQSLACSQRG